MNFFIWVHALMTTFALSHAYRIDLHNHIIPPFYLDFLAQQGYVLPSPPPWNDSLLLSYMEEYGVKTTIVSFSTPGVRPFSNTSVAEARSMARKLNVYAYDELVKKYPGKFQFWATVTLPDVEGSMKEVEFALVKLKAAGVFLEANKLGVYLGDPALDPFFNLLNHLNAVVFVHPSGLPNVASLPGIPAGVLDFAHDTTRAALNLVFTNTTQKYPNIKYLLANAGGSLPFLAYRVAFSSKYYSLKVMLEEFKKFYYDTTFASTPSALPSIVEFASPNGITFGSDWPFGAAVGLSFYTSSLDSFNLPEADRVRINSSNAEALGIVNK